MQLGMRDYVEDGLPFEGLDTSTALQEAKAFNSGTLDTRKCKATLIKILYLMAFGESVQGKEATELFFNTTKLLQSTDQTLRRLVYVMVKELAEKKAENVFMLVNVMCKDLGGTDMEKANAIRALRKITDVSMLSSIERHLQQAVVDKAEIVSSAAMVTGIHLAKVAPDSVKKWSGEVGEALKQRGVMAQYHALALLYKVRRTDKLFVSKLVSSAETIPIRSPLALCLLIRMCGEVLKDDWEGSPELARFVGNSLKNSSEMVVSEGVKCLCSLKNVPSKDLSPAILVLQLYLTSHKPVHRFTAVRLLDQVASTQPLAVTPCTIDTESLITDPNRNIATLAITTLLKTGNEFSIDRLMKQINSFLSDIADEFKIVVIEAMKLLCVKFPHKHGVLLSFLSEALREEGGFEFKKTIVDAIITIIDNVPAAKEDGLVHLCEFIEDCEFTGLSQRILHLLGQLGPSTTNPHKYIRYIYNRVILETPAVRAASVSALAKFAAACVPLRTSVRVLLNRVRGDNDDEVRDRAVFYLRVLDTSEEDIQSFILDVATKRRRTIAPLEYKEVPYDEEGEPRETGEAEEHPAESARANQRAIEQAVAALLKNPETSQFGQPHNTTEPEYLTDMEGDYVVTYIKHTYPSNTIFQYSVKNNMEDLMENLSVKMDSGFEDMEEASAIPIAELNPGETSSCYVIFDKEPDVFPTGACATVLCLTLREVDKDTGEVEPGGTEDDYQLEEVVLNVSDYMEPMDSPNFFKEWDDVGELEEYSQTYSLPTLKSLQAAADEVVNFLGMEPHGTTKVVPPKSKSHNVLLAGRICTQPPCKMLVKATVFYSDANVVTLDFCIRGGTEELRTFLAEELT